MDFFRPDKKGRRFHLVYKEDIRVLEDYVQSLALFDRVIQVGQFSPTEFLASDDIYVFTQMWLPVQQSLDLVRHPRFIFLNVENLTEQSRFNQVRAFLDNGARVADYSLANIKLVETEVQMQGQSLHLPMLHFPYQAHPRDFAQIFNPEHHYDVDVGIINAYVEPNFELNAEGLVYRRNLLWQELQRQSDISSINVMGWGRERDAITQRCRIIANVHHFECFRIFQHIRCDRLIFANKVVVSEDSLMGDQLDLAHCFISCHYDNLIATLRQSLQQFDRIQETLEAMPKQPIYQARRQDFQMTLDKLLQQIEESGH